MTFVNHLGEVVSPGRLAASAPKRLKKEPKDSYHNGWRVQGIPPGALEAARTEHHSDASGARLLGKPFKDWDESHWLMNAKRKPVRAKPYEVPQAAQECKAMAEKAGWLRVEVVELKKEANA
jgi:hypothetical protein